MRGECPRSEHERQRRVSGRSRNGRPPFVEDAFRDACGRTSDGYGGKRQPVSVKQWSCDAMDAFKMFALVQGVSEVAYFLEFRLQRPGAEDGFGREGAKLKAFKNFAPFGFRQEGEHCFSGGAALGGRPRAQIDHVFEGMAGGNLLENHALGVCEDA